MNCFSELQKLTLILVGAEETCWTKPDMDPVHYEFTIQQADVTHTYQ